MHTHSEEFFALAEQLAEVKGRFERVESEFATQAKPLEAASVALGAVVEGLRAMKDHALGESIAAVAQKLEETRATIGEQIEVVVSGLQNADAQQSTATAEATAAFRAECAAIREQIGQIATQFGAEVSRVALEAKARAEQLEKTALAVGRDGADGKSVNPTGSYAADRAYNRLDIVSYMGGSYVSNVDSNREKPGAKSKNWTQLASRGAGGGITSVEGIPGINANVVGFLQTPTSANLRTAITDETGTGAAVFANTPTLVTPVLGAATGTSLDLSGNLTVTGAGLFGAATGGMPAAGVINATGFKINGVDVATSSDSFWSSVTGGINYGGGKVGVGMTPSKTLDVAGTLGTTGAASFGGNVTLTGATASATLGTATETLAIAVTAAGAGTITTKAGQDLTIANGTSGAVKATGTGAHVFGTTNTVTLSGGAITATGNIASSAATGTLTLGAATETLTIAATAAGAGTITTKAGQDLTIANGALGALKVTGTGAHVFGTTNTVTLSAGAVTATGNIASSAATGSLTLGAATETLTIAATAAGAGTITTKSGQDLTITTGAGALKLPATTAATSSAGVVRIGSLINFDYVNIGGGKIVTGGAIQAGPVNTSTSQYLAGAFYGGSNADNSGAYIDITYDAGNYPGLRLYGGRWASANRGGRLVARNSVGNEKSYLHLNAEGDSASLFTSANVGIGIDSSGNLTASATTASSSTTTGALVVSGGAGIAGALFTGGAITTGTPNGGTAGAWKHGIRVAATVALDTTQYIQLDVGGTLYKLAVVS